MVDKDIKGSRLSKYAIFLGIILVMFIALTFTMSSTLATPQMEEKICGSCHQMSPELLTWKNTSHNRVACTSCHPDSSLATMIMNSRSGNYYKITTKETVPDSACLTCHTKDRTVTPPHSLIVSHSLHVSKEINCVRCHRNVAHSLVADKVLDVGKKDFYTFIEKDAQELSSFGNTIPMFVCMKCHNGAKAPKDCLACHENKPVPESHQAPGFKTGAHGAAAYQNLSSCNQCHEYDVAKQKTANAKNLNYPSLQSYARTSDFCSGCHKNRPASHDSFYSVRHKQKAMENIQNCYVCHNAKPDTQLATPPAPKVVCSSCHATKIHPADWIQVHPTKAKADGAVECFSCHDQASCTKCHSARGVNVKK